MIMIHPNLQNAWTVATEGVQATQKVWFGLYSIDMVGYQGHVIPVIIAVWVLAQIEKRLHKVVPAMFDLFVTPLVSVFVTGYLTLSIIGPIFVAVENGLLDGIQWLIALPFGIGSFIMGAFMHRQLLQVFITCTPSLTLDRSPNSALPTGCHLHPQPTLHRVVQLLL